jgi:hypothetical protein
VTAIASKSARPKRRQTLEELRDLQRMAARAIMRPLGRGQKMQRTWIDGRPTARVIGQFIKPNDRLTSLERLEIYNRQYWFRLIDCLHDDFPGLRAVLGRRRFDRVIETYLENFPSRSYSLRNLSGRMEQFIAQQPDLLGDRLEIALEMARFEWAQVIAFDSAAKPPARIDEIAGVEPAALRLGLQPHLTLLHLHYPLDDFSIALKRLSTRVDASNAVEARPIRGRASRIRLPRRQEIHLAVHRWQSGLYYKRLSPVAHAILTALRDGKSLQRACATAMKEPMAMEGGEDPAIALAEDLHGWFANWARMGWFCKRD